MHIAKFGGTVTLDTYKEYTSPYNAERSLAIDKLVNKGHEISSISNLEFAL